LLLLAPVPRALRRPAIKRRVVGRKDADDRRPRPGHGCETETGWLGAGPSVGARGRRGSRSPDSRGRAVAPRRRGRNTASTHYSATTGGLRRRPDAAAARTSTRLTSGPPDRWSGPPSEGANHPPRGCIPGEGRHTKP